MIRSLARSIGCKGQNNTNGAIIDRYSCSSNIFSSSRSSPFLHSIHGVGENPKYMCYKAEGEAKRGHSSYLLSLATKFRNGTEQIKELIKGPSRLKEGDTVDLSALLFTEDRDYLIKCNGRQQVKAEELQGKVVVIYFDSVLNMWKDQLRALTFVYNDLLPKNNFEVVFVDMNDVDVTPRFNTPHDVYPGEPLKNVLLTMPWPAIPLSDTTSRKHLKQIFGHSKKIYPGNVFIIDQRGTIVQWAPPHIFSRYGAAGYPFDKKRIDFLNSEDDKAVKEPTLKALLASSERDYLISNDGVKVPIDTLEDKVVALFFYYECKYHREFTAELKVAYEELSQKHEKFEVVLIYIYDTAATDCITSEKTFSDTFKTMPWLALPFGDSNYKKLERLFFIPWEYDWDDDMIDYTLIVVGPHMKFVQPFGLTILSMFKSPAYPFTCERVAELVAEKVKEIKLEMLWETKGVFGGQRGSQVQLSEFAKKRVIVLFDWYEISIEPAVRFIEKLKERYETLRDTDKAFEVIHVTLESSSNEHDIDLPWVKVTVQSYADDELNLFGICGTRTKYPSLLAFNEDGRVVRKTIYPGVMENEFPFDSASLEEDTLEQLVEIFDWNWVRRSNPDTIYSHPKL